MSCVREASLEPPVPYRAAHAHDDAQRHGEGRKGRFLRGLRRMFRRRAGGARAAPADRSPEPDKSRSTSELLAADHRQRRKEGAYSSGLSVSHDSVFTGDRSGDSGDERATPPHLVLSGGHRAELVAAVRRRGGRGTDGSDDEDLGLPRSPPASPPTDKADKRHHAGISASSCSDGSLLSVGSSEMDEDSAGSLDLAARHPHDYRGEPPSGLAPLSHSAARHKMAVRPRRTHGAPRRKRNVPIAAQALPITPELNEEMMRSTTPDVKHKTSEVVTESLSSSTTTKKTLVKEIQSQLTNDLNRLLETTSGDVKLKSSSLPPGLALSQLVGQSPAKLSLADPQDTPRSSIKRSKSSSQGKFLRDDQPQVVLTSTSQSHYQRSTAEERVSRYTRHEEDERKSRSEKKGECETIKTSTKKEESFFSRLRLRKSGKKVKKEEEAHENKKSKPPDKLVNAQYKSIDREYTSSMAYSEYRQRTQSSERSAHKSAGQRAFANQVHRRLDCKGTYVNDNVYKELQSVAKTSVIDYGANDLKLAEETDKMLNMDINLKYAYSKSDHQLKRHTTKESDLKTDSFNLHGTERINRPPLAVQRLIDPYSSKSFITNEVANLSRENSHVFPNLILETTDSSLANSSQRPGRNDFVFHSGSMPKNIPYFNQNLKLSASASPPRSVLHKSSENVENFNRSTDLSSVRYPSNDPEQLMQARISQTDSYFPSIGQLEVEKDFVNGLKSLGEEFVEQRNSIGKSHSFRHHSETNSISSQENQMPSLPAIVGISEPLMESWEVNYRRSVSHDRFNERNSESKRLSARNYNVFNPNDNLDSLPSTDSSYLDSLKGEPSKEERKSIFINVNSEGAKRNCDISQIEAKIDTIIGSPKPFNSSVLKSSSLDSVKSLAEKPTSMEERRKTISIESTLSHDNKMSSFNRRRSKEIKAEQEGFVSITHLNKELSSDKTKPCEPPKLIKSEEKLPTNSKSGVPEFLKIQLNKVDSKPVSNVVLTANVTPKKPEPVPVETILAETENDEDSNESPLQMYLRKTGSQQLLNKSLELLGEDSQAQKLNDKPAIIIRHSPLNFRKTFIPQSPTNPKMFIKKKATSIDSPDVHQEKVRTNSLNIDNGNDRIFDNFSSDQKSFSSFGSKTSLQSSDSNEAKTPERQEDGVVYRRKPIVIPKEQRNGSKYEDEPELMKVFARRSLKLKDSEAETLAQEIAEANHAKDELADYVFPSKSKKNEFNSSIKSRDSDKENEEQTNKNFNSDQKNDIDANKWNNDKVPNIQSRTSHFGGSHYQRSISVTSVSSIQGNAKRDSAPAQMKAEVNKYRKEISDSTPEKRLRNRTFPDSSNGRDELKNVNVKNESIRPSWLQPKNEEFKKDPVNNDLKKEKEVEGVKEESRELKEMAGEAEEKESGGEMVGETDGSPQFKGILQMREEWERRAQQGTTK